jgi:hypothetical protein
VDILKWIRILRGKTQKVETLKYASHGLGVRYNHRGKGYISLANGSSLQKLGVIYTDGPTRSKDKRLADILSKKNPFPAIDTRDKLKDVQSCVKLRVGVSG